MSYNFNLKLKKSVCGVLIISMLTSSLTACNNNVGSAPNSLAVAPVSSMHLDESSVPPNPSEVHDYKKDLYQLDYKQGVGYLFNTQTYKGEFYYTKTAIVWINQNYKVTVLKGLSLSEEQLTKYEALIKLIAEKASAFEVISDENAKSVIVKSEVSPTANQLFILTSENKFIQIDLATGNSSFENEIYEFNYNLANNHLLLAKQVNSEV